MANPRRKPTICQLLARLVSTSTIFVALVACFLPESSLAASFSNPSTLRNDVYHPQFIAKEVCADLTAEQCKAYDQRRKAEIESLSDANQIANERLLREQLQRQQQERRNNHKNRNLQSPSNGNFKVFMLLLRFTNHVSDRLLPTQQYFQNLCDNGGTTEAAWDNSLQRYFALQSANTYQIECTVTDWVDSDNTDAFYAGGNSNTGSNNNAAQNMFRYAMTQYDLTQSPGWGFAFDQEGGFDYSFDMFVVIHSGYSSLSLANPTCDGAARNDRIQSQGRYFSSNGWATSGIPNTKVSGFAIASAFEDGGCNTPFARMGIIAHEMTHTFQTQDLYDVNVAQIGGAGYFGLMASLRGPGGSNGWAAGSLCPFTKQVIGWADITVIDADGSYNIEDVASSDQIYRIDHGFADGEYLLIENRQQKDFDILMPNSGILIWHIDENIQNNNQGSAVPPTQGSHYQVAVVQKDGQYDIETGTNSGDASDFWEYLDTLTPGTGNTHPNSDSFYNGETGISIRVMSESSDIMTFFVSGINPSPIPFPSPPGPDTPVPTPLPTERPTPLPTPRPTPAPVPPTNPPTQPPTKEPTKQPTKEPTKQPTKEPTKQPTNAPTESPTEQPSRQPVTIRPTPPSIPTNSAEPTTAGPTVFEIPTAPSPPTEAPSDAPSGTPIGTSTTGGGIPTAPLEIPTAAPSTTVTVTQQSTDNGKKGRDPTSPLWLISYIGFAALMGVAFFYMRKLLLRLNEINKYDPALNPPEGPLNPSGDDGFHDEPASSYQDNPDPQPSEGFQDDEVI